MNFQSSLASNRMWCVLRRKHTLIFGFNWGLIVILFHLINKRFNIFKGMNWEEYKKKEKGRKLWKLKINFCNYFWGSQFQTHCLEKMLYRIKRVKIMRKKKNICIKKQYFIKVFHNFCIQKFRILIWKWEFIKRKIVCLLWDFVLLKVITVFSVIKQEIMISNVFYPYTRE